MNQFEYFNNLSLFAQDATTVPPNINSPPTPPLQQAQPISQPQPSPILPSPSVKKSSGKKIKLNILLLIAILAVVIIIVVAFLFLQHNHSTKTTTALTSLNTTTISKINVSALNSCRQINVSGSYFLQSNIHTSQSSGPCINITASNVKLVCNQNHISGSGPYLDTPPFTYGIMISKVSNVSIEDCQISNFSFGILSANSNHALILNNNISQNYVSEIDFINSSTNYVANNYISKSSSGNGAVNITNNSRNNGFMRWL